MIALRIVSACALALALAGCQQDPSQPRPSTGAASGAVSGLATPAGIAYDDFAATASVKQAKLAPGGGFFLTAQIDTGDIPTVRLWRVEGNRGLAVADWTLPAHKDFDLRQQAAVSPDGRYVAISAVPGTFQGHQDLRLYRVGRSGSEKVAETDFGTQAANVKSCGLEFMPNGDLLACRGNWQDTRLGLIGGFAKDDPAIIQSSLLRTNVDYLGKIDSLTVSPHGGIGAKVTRSAAAGGGVSAIVTAASFAVENGKIVPRRAALPWDRLARWKIGQKHESWHAHHDVYSVIPLPPAGGKVLVNSLGRLEIWPETGTSPLAVMPGYRGVSSVSSDGAFAIDANGSVHLLEKNGPRVHKPGEGLDSVMLDGTRTILSVTPKKLDRYEITEQRQSAARTLDEGLSMIKAGFAQPGFARLRQSIDLDPDYWAGHDTPGSEIIARDVSEGTIKAPLSEVGGFLQRLLQALSVSAPGSLVPGGRLGVGKFDNATSEWRIDSVNKCFSHHPLFAAGVRDGDRILSIAGQVLAGPDAYNDLVKTLQPGSRVQIVTVRNGGAPVATEIPVLPNWERQRSGHYYTDLMNFGLLAAQAGHSGIAMQAEARIRQMVAEYHLCSFAVTGANLLGGLARAMNGGAEAGYDYILAQGGLVQHGVKVVSARYAEDFATAAAPLYADRNKLAFLMETTPDKLPKPSLSPRAPQPYPDLTGRIIEPSGASASPAPVLIPAAERNTLAPPSGSGQILD